MAMTSPTHYHLLLCCLSATSLCAGCYCLAAQGRGGACLHGGGGGGGEGGGGLPAQGPGVPAQGAASTRGCLHRGVPDVGGEFIKAAIGF